VSYHELFVFNLKSFFSYFTMYSNWQKYSRKQYEFCNLFFRFL